MDKNDPVLLALIARYEGKNSADVDESQIPDGYNYSYLEVPTHIQVRYEGQVTVPADNEDSALYEVTKALETMNRQFDIYSDDEWYKAPEILRTWITGMNCNLIITDIHKKDEDTL